MRCLECPRWMLVVCFVLVTLGAAGCAQEAAEIGASGTGGTAEAAFVVSAESTYLVIENRTGVPIVEGTVEILPRGPRQPFVARLSRMENQNRENVPFSRLSTNDGTPYSRRIAKARAIRVKGTDMLGKVHEITVPFE